MSGRPQIQMYARRDGNLGWRLLGANNHEIGRSVRAHLDRDACQREIALLQRDSQRVEGRLRRATENRWIWEARLDGEQVAVAAHSFDRPIRCQQSLHLFTAELPRAEVGAILPARALPGRRLPSIRAVPHMFGAQVVPGRP